jgi:hypothetical protein
VHVGATWSNAGCRSFFLTPDTIFDTFGRIHPCIHPHLDEGRPTEHKAMSSEKEQTTAGGGGLIGGGSSSSTIAAGTKVGSGSKGSGAKASWRTKLPMLVTPINSQLFVCFRGGVRSRLTPLSSLQPSFQPRRQKMPSLLPLQRRPVLPGARESCCFEQCSFCLPLLFYSSSQLLSLLWEMPVNLTLARMLRREC